MSEIKIGMKKNISHIKKQWMVNIKIYFKLVIKNSQKF